MISILTRSFVKILSCVFFSSDISVSFSFFFSVPRKARLGTSERVAGLILLLQVRKESVA